MENEEKDSYGEWARILFDKFFSHGMDGQRTRLMVSTEWLDDEYPYLNGSKGFLHAVARGPLAFRHRDEPPLGEGLFFHKHALLLYRLWRRAPERRPDNLFQLPDNGPLFLPHLVTLCLAWTVENPEMHFNEFYRRLGELMPGHGMEPMQLALWRRLWDGLEEWTGKLEGRRGNFIVERLGHNAHVGIPRAQVILTATKIRRLPELFCETGLADTWNEGMSAGELRTTLLGNETISKDALGQLLYSEILDDNAIGKAGLGRLLEELAKPESRKWEPKGGGGGRDEPEDEDNHSREVLPLKLVLEIEGNRWSCFFGLLGVDAPAPPLKEDGWSFRLVEAVGRLYLAHNPHSGEAPIDAAEWGALHEGFSIPMDGDGLPGAGEETLLKFRGTGIRILKFFNNTRLVEDDSLPLGGLVYVLVTAGVTAAFDGWAESFKAAGGTVDDYSQEGLPLMCRLLCLGNLDVLTDELLQTFPGSSRVSREAGIRLVNGSRVESMGNHPAYLPYDLPDVVFAHPAPAKLIVTGAELREVGPVEPRQGGLPGCGEREFALDIEPGASMVRITSSSDEEDWVPEVRQFVISEEGLTGPEVEEVRFERFGRRSGGVGVLGPLIDQEGLDGEGRGDFVYREVDDFERGEPFTRDILEHNCWKLLESVSQKRRVTAKEFKRRATRILGRWDKYGWNEVRWTRALCYLEVERDKRGRLAYVYRVAPHVYLLPWRTGGKWMAVVGGCPTRESLGELAEVASSLGVEIHVRDSGSWLVPPRFLLSSGDLDALELVCLEAGFPLHPGRSSQGDPVPLCRQHAGWAGSVDEWHENLQWIDGPGPRPEQWFCPWQFRAREKEFNCRVKLSILTDKLTQANKWHLLREDVYDKDFLNVGPRHGFLVDPTWGKWISVNRAHAREKVPVPYYAASSSLCLPASLVFPTMLCRAVLICSGLAPLPETGCPEYEKPTSLFLTDPAPPYQGAVYRYQNVPLEIAKIVMDKLNARPVDPNTAD